MSRSRGQSRAITATLTLALLAITAAVAWPRGSAVVQDEATHPLRMSLMEHALGTTEPKQVMLSDPDAAISRRFPAQAARVVEGPGFRDNGSAFVLNVAEGVDPVRAAEAALTERGALRIELPRDPSGSVTFALPGGFSIQVRERGLKGSGRRALGAIAYERDGGTSYWNATTAGYEEWLHVENAGDGPVAEWEVSGATLRQGQHQVDIIDATGAPRLRVVAPEAFADGGKPATAWLEVRDNVVALFTDARGVALVDPAWTAVGSMSTSRALHSATLLPSGRVLVTGGSPGTAAGCVASAELYDPATGTWDATAAMAAPRCGHTASFLRTGKVLVAGGSDGTGPIASAEIYDPLTGAWASVASLSTARMSHTATVLRSGKVLVAGGTGDARLLPWLSSAELFDPVTGHWSAAAPMPSPRSSHSATLLPSGEVLVAGGRAGSSFAIASADVYQPDTNAWTVAGSLVDARAHHTATLLPSGQVLAAGGRDVAGSALASAELYDPATRTWTSTGPMEFARHYHSATLLPSGKVFVFGPTGDGATATGEVYDATTGTWAASAMSISREGHTATLLASGDVIIVGGVGGAVPLASAERLDPTAPSWLPTTAPAAMSTARVYHTATLLPSGKVLVAGGANGGTLSTVELYDPATATWSAARPLTTPRQGHTATLLASGRVLVAGGLNGGEALRSAEVYDPSTGSWATTASMATTRWDHTATLLPSGEVLVSGGVGRSAAELYDPFTGSWTTTGSMSAQRFNHTATLLRSGEVLVAGGGVTNVLDGLASAELYDRNTGTWTAIGSMASARRNHTATLLPSGQVLVAGGSDGDTSLASAELYDLTTGAWTVTGPMSGPASANTATLLNSGEVLVAGQGSADLYDPATRTWTSTGRMSSFKYHHTATLLPSGEVLVAGGGLPPQASAELYVPATGAWLSPSRPRWNHTATLLPSGKVVVIGGRDAGSETLRSAEIHDYVAARTAAVDVAWSSLEPMIEARFGHAATLLRSGEVLVVGGTRSGNSVLTSAEQYDPTTGRWTPAGSMSVARRVPRATLLTSGKVLVTGDGSPELYDPATRSWSRAGPMANHVRALETATLLHSGKVLVSGGTETSVAELYDPAANSWSAAGTMAHNRRAHTATLLPSGKVLVAGGFDASWTAVYATAELYDPATNEWSPTGSLSIARGSHTATLLPSGKVLVAGGQDDGGHAIGAAEIYDPATGIWSRAPETRRARSSHTATLLPSGNVVVLGGAISAAPEVFDEGRGSLPARAPVLHSPIAATASCGVLELAGALFTGDSEGSSGGGQSSPSNSPVVDLSRYDNGARAYASVLGFTSTSIVATLPAVAPGPSWARVTVNGVPSAAQYVEIVPAGESREPLLSGISPDVGPTTGGTEVEMIDLVDGFETVTFDGIPATCVPYLSHPGWYCIAPPHPAGPVDVVVTGSCGSTTLAGAFTYYAPAPVITGVVPSGGPLAGGNTVAVTGSNFASGATVTLGGRAVLNLAIASESSLSFTAPAGTPGTVSLVVTNPDGSSATSNYLYVAPPLLTSLTPARGPWTGNTLVALRGSNFANYTRVRFGTLELTPQLLDTSTIAVTTPPAAVAGSVDVTAFDLLGQSSTLAGGFTYTYALRLQQSATDGWTSPGEVQATGPGFVLTCTGASCAGDVGAQTTVQVCATASAGYEFASWSGACVANSSCCSFLISRDADVHASYSKVWNTPVGASVQVAPAGGPSVSLEFETVIAEGDTSVAPTTSVPPPDGYFALNAPGTSFDIATTASYVGKVELAVRYDPAALGLSANEQRRLRVLHYSCSSGTCNWEDITEVTNPHDPEYTALDPLYFGRWDFPNPDTANHVVYGVTTSLSPFLLALGPEPALTVAKTGSGSGIVTSDPAGISCGTACSASFPQSLVTLTATADPNSTFAGWSSGGCSGTGPCQVTLEETTTVTATFTTLPVVSHGNVSLASADADQPLIVPTGVTEVTVDMWGAGGEFATADLGGLDCEYQPGGGGGYVNARISVTPGEVLTVRVGGAPKNLTGAGWPNGGRGWLDEVKMGRRTYVFGMYGGAGGSSSILRGTTVLAEAGGGNGGIPCAAPLGGGVERNCTPFGNQPGANFTSAGEAGGGGWCGGGLNQPSASGVAAIRLAVAPANRETPGAPTHPSRQGAGQGGFLYAATPGRVYISW